MLAETEPMSSPVEFWPTGASLNFTAAWRGKTGAALRLSRAKDASIDPSLTCLLATLSPVARRDLTVCTLEGLREDGPASVLLTSVFFEAYRVSLEAGVRRWAIAAPAQLIANLEDLGFRSTGAVIEVPWSGSQCVMVLDLFDVAHLWSVESPLLSAARAFAGGGEPTTLDASTAIFLRPAYDRGLPRIRSAATMARGIDRLRQRRAVFLSNHVR